MKHINSILNPSQQQNQKKPFWKHISPDKRVRNKERNQVWKQLDSEINSIIRNNPEEYFAGLTKGTRKLLNYFFKYGNRYFYFYPAQSTLARWCKLSRSYVNQIIQKLEELGIITKVYRHMTSCMYKLSSYFDNPYIRSRLSHIFLAFRYFTVTWLLSSAALQAHKKQKLTQENIIAGRLLNKEQVSLSNIDIYRETVSASNIAVNFYNKKGDVRSMFAEYGPEKPMSMAIRNIKSFKPTLKGQIRLSAFADIIISEADTRMLQLSDYPGNAFAWFHKVCEMKCQEKNIEPDWNRVRHLAQLYNVDTSDNLDLYDKSFRPSAIDRAAVLKKTANPRGSSARANAFQLLAAAKQPDVKSTAERYKESKAKDIKNSRIIRQEGLRNDYARAMKCQLWDYQRTGNKEYLEAAERYKKLIEDLDKNGIREPEEEIVKIEALRHSPQSEKMVKIFGREWVDKYLDRMIQVQKDILERESLQTYNSE